MPQVEVANPEESQWWTSRLVWMMDFLPQVTLELWNSPGHEKLLRHLDEKAAMAIFLDVNRFKGEPEDVKQEMLAQVICPSDMEEPEEEMPEAIRMEILDWAENLDLPNTPGEKVRLVTITV